MDAEMLKLIVDLGSTGMLLVILHQVWVELKLSNQRMFDMLQRQVTADDERAELKQKVETFEALLAKTKKPAGD